MKLPQSRITAASLQMQTDQATNAATKNDCVNQQTPMDQSTTDELETVGMKVAEEATPSVQQLLSDAATSSGTTNSLKYPNNPSSHRNVPIEISDNESGESSTEMFRKVKRAKGRSKKLRDVSPPFVMLSDVYSLRNSQKSINPNPNSNCTASKTNPE